MFIIWGTRGFNKIMGYTKQYTCRHCNNISAWELVRTSRWFTLFFIPIFPFSFKYLALCPVCQHGAQLSKEDFQRELADGPQSTEPAQLDQ